MNVCSILQKSSLSSGQCTLWFYIKTQVCYGFSVCIACLLSHIPKTLTKIYTDSLKFLAFAKLYKFCSELRRLIPVPKSLPCTTWAGMCHNRQGVIKDYIPEYEPQVLKYVLCQ